VGQAGAGIRELDDWLDRRGPHIAAQTANHATRHVRRTTGGIEKALEVVKSRLYDPRASNVTCGGFIAGRPRFGLTVTSTPAGRKRGQWLGTALELAALRIGRRARADGERRVAQLNSGTRRPGMSFGPATNRQATGWVTVRRPTCWMITDAV